MDLSKEGLIQRLLKEGKITQDEAYLLRRKEKEIEYIPTPNPNDIIHPVLPKIGKKPTWIDPRQQWINDEMDKRMKHVENCACNPANGGSGMCGCTLGSPLITC
jgi:hypothetical protein